MRGVAIQTLPLLFSDGRIPQNPVTPEKLIYILGARWRSG
jgi:hypothetical protein